MLSFLYWTIYDGTAVSFAAYINCSSSHQNHGVLLKQPSILWKLLVIYVLPNWTDSSMYQSMGPLVIVSARLRSYSRLRHSFLSASCTSDLWRPSCNTTLNSHEPWKILPPAPIFNPLEPYLTNWMQPCQNQNIPKGGISEFYWGKSRSLCFSSCIQFSF